MTKPTGEDAYRFLADYEFFHDAESEKLLALERLCPSPYADYV
jgi:hypothetical protein